MKKAHFTLQGKGGVGKSYVSSILTQYHQANKLPVVAIDTDPVNKTLLAYTSLNARVVQLMDQKTQTLVERKFDEILEMIVSEDENFVVDNGAASFLQLSNYMIENDAFNVIRESGKEVVVHTIITGGQAMLDTLRGFVSLASQLPADVTLVVWLNEYFGDIVQDGKSFEEFKAYQQFAERVNAIVRIPRQTSSTFGKDVEMMLEKRLTFDDVANAKEWGVMAKQRLATVRRNLFDQMGKVV